MISTAGKRIGRKSQCEPLAEVILAKVEVGLSAQLNLDNMKAAVPKADCLIALIFDPQINPKLPEFCRHLAMYRSAPRSWRQKAQR